MFRHCPAWVVVLALTAAIALQPEPAPAAEVSPFLPDDTEVVAFVNVRQLLNAPLVKKHALEQIKATIKDNPEVPKFLDAVGLDPLRDISSVTLAGPGKDMQTRALFIVNGTFNVDKIHALADEVIKASPDALKIHKHGNLRIYENKAGDGGASGFAAFVDRNTLLVSPSKESILASVRVGEAKAPRVKQELQTLIQQTDARPSVWFAALATAEVKEMLKSNAETARVADKITSFNGNVSMTNAAQAAVQIHATDLGSAGEVQRLMEAIKGFVQFAALSNKEYGPLFSDILDAMKVSSQRNVVTIGGKVTDELIEKGLKKGRKP